MESFSALLAICARIHRSPVKSPHKGQPRGALMLSLICVWVNVWVNNREADDLRRYRTHYDVTVMSWAFYQLLEVMLKTYSSPTRILHDFPVYTEPLNICVSVDQSPCYTGWELHCWLIYRSYHIDDKLWSLDMLQFCEAWNLFPCY